MKTFIQLAGRGIRDLWQRPLAQVFTLAAVTLSAFLASLFLFMLHNVDKELMRHRGEVQFQIYWEEQTDMQEVKKIWDSLRVTDGILDLQTYTPEQARNELIAALDSNTSKGRAQQILKNDSPLPPTALVRLRVPENVDGWTRQVYDQLTLLPGVEKVHYNPMQMDIARTWARISRTFVWPLIGLLSLVAGLIVGNTIKLYQLSRQDEVEILSLVGASRFYIELPLLAGGAFQGLVGSALAALLLKVLQFSIVDIINTAPLYLRLDYPPLLNMAGLVGLLTLVGLLSSWAAIRH